MGKMKTIRRIRCFSMYKLATTWEKYKNGTLHCPLLSMPSPVFVASDCTPSFFLFLLFFFCLHRPRLILILEELNDEFQIKFLLGSEEFRLDSIIEEPEIPERHCFRLPCY